MPKPKASILVVFYSRDGSIEALAKAVSEVTLTSTERRSPGLRHRPPVHLGATRQPGRASRAIV